MPKYKWIETLQGDPSDQEEFEAENFGAAMKYAEGNTPENSGFFWESSHEYVKNDQLMDFAIGEFEFVDEETGETIEGTMSVETVE